MIFSYKRQNSHFLVTLKESVDGAGTPEHIFVRWGWERVAVKIMSTATE